MFADDGILLLVVKTWQVRVAHSPYMRHFAFPPPHPMVVPCAKHTTQLGWMKLPKFELASEGFKARLPPWSWHHNVPHNTLMTFLDTLSCHMAFTHHLCHCTGMSPTLVRSRGSIGASASSSTFTVFANPLAAAQSRGVHRVQFLLRKFSY